MKASKCEWPGCPVTIEQPKRGRPRKFCAEHAQASAAASKRLYKSRDYKKNLAKAVDSRLPECCQDCQRMHPKRNRCDQHKQWAQFVRDRGKAWRSPRRHSKHDSPEEAQFWEVINNGGFRITSNPDNWNPR
jgi:hypothetical protein